MGRRSDTPALLFIIMIIRIITSSRCCGVPIMLIPPRSGSSTPIRRSPTLSLRTHGSFPPALTSHQYVPIRADSVTRSNPSAESNHSFVLFLSVLPVFSCQTSFFCFFLTKKPFNVRQCTFSTDRKRTYNFSLYILYR